jgi:peptide/nickel transport system substrate-binding protein
VGHTKEQRGRHKLAVGGVAVAVAGTALGLAGTGVGAAGAASHAKASAIQTGGVIKFAEGPASPPNYIFPETSSANQSIYNNSNFINLMWPLMYQPNPYQPENDYAHSVGEAPVASNNGTVFTVQLRHWMWSDGQPVTARDVIFYINLGRAMGTSWGNYAGPTQFPYNVKSVTAVNPYELKFVTTAPVNPTYFADNALGEITPMPQHAWDKESASGPVGNYDETPAGAAKVLAFLQKEANDTSTYTTNPLWKVVDGPWTLKSFGGASSPDIFVPNPSFSGQKPYVSEFEEIPFTSTSAEFTSLKTGPSTLTAGWVPSEDIPAIPSIQAEGYNITKQPEWGFDYIIPNTQNPQVGPVLSQIYIRQVLAHLMDQNTIIKVFRHGYGVPTYGAVPVYPKGNPFLTSAEASNPYPYSVSAAEQLLAAHGWKVNPGGTDYCAKPGSAADECGKGVAMDQQLSLNLIYSSGSVIGQEENDLFVSDAAKAGVRINASAEDFNTVISQVQPCTKKAIGTATCNWQLGEYGGISEATFPSGAGLFNTGGAFNAGQYSNPLMDKLIQQSTVASNLQPFYQYENLVVHEEPWIWQPVGVGVDVTAKNLSGYGLTGEYTGIINAYIEPNFWYFTK